MNQKAQSLSILFTVLIVVLPLVTWGLALMLSKSKELQLSTFFKSSWTNFVALLSKRPTLFALSLILMIVTPPLAMQPKGSPLSMLGSLTSASAYICMLACQVITYKSNSQLFEPQGLLASRNNFVMGYHLFVLQLFMFFASLLGLLFFAVPAIIFKIYTFMASPISVCECKSLGAIWRSLKLSKSHFWDVAKISLPFLIGINLPLVILPALKHGIEEPVVLTITLTALRIFEFFANTLSWQCQSMLYDHLKPPGEADGQS